MANAAWAMGLGTCWVGNFDAQKLAVKLGIPEEWPIFTVLPFGYPSTANPPQPKALKPRAEVVHYERWGHHTP
jgi:nitroreductase